MSNTNPTQPPQPPLSYHGDAAFKRRFVRLTDAHKRADRLQQGHYGMGAGKEWKGCAVACSLRSLDKIDGKPERNLLDSHSDLSRRLGIPQTLAHLEDRIFEGLKTADAREWPSRFARAIPVGADLSGVWPRFALWLLTDSTHGVAQYARSDAARKVIGAVAALYAREIAGDEPGIEEWRTARADAADTAAAAAAYAAAAANADANTAAAYAANAVACRKCWYDAAADQLVALLQAANK